MPLLIAAIPKHIKAKPILIESNMDENTGQIINIKPKSIYNNPANLSLATMSPPIYAMIINMVKILYINNQLIKEKLKSYY